MAELKRILRTDLTYNNGKILSSMSTRSHSFAKQTYCMFLDKNLADPELFPGTVKLEREAVEMLGSLLSKRSACGQIVSGGSEANLLALLSARTLNGARNEVIAPTSAHSSIDRAAWILGLKLVKVPIDYGYKADVDEISRAISNKTLAIVGTAGTTGLGVVDPIREIGKLASDHQIHFHVDAAFGGFVLPFLERCGYTAEKFDFQVEGVTSITVDPHKMGMCPIPAGAILFRDPSLLRALQQEVPYIASEPFQATVTLSKPGASAIAVWAMLKHLGREGYVKIVRKCMQLTQVLAGKVEGMRKFQLVIQPPMNIVGIRTSDLRRVVAGLKREGWAVGMYEDYIRLVVMPHLTMTKIRTFISHMKEQSHTTGCKHTPPG